MPTIEILSLIVNFLLSSGLVGVMIFYRAKRRTANAEATTSEHSAESAALSNMHQSLVEWKEIAEARETKIIAKDAKLDAKDALIDRLYLEKGEDRKEIHRLNSEIARLQLEIQASKFIECKKRGCADREPQSGY